ncbi:hypothetical protein H0H87_009480 [Tephrocybe sp. NHM501043]|nr:hypothetical protein H0H87_009480 [Tephrocybe sp. NHM501043]
MPSSSSAPVLPPVEDLFIPEAIDFNFKHNADQPFFTFSDPSASSEPTVISQLEFGRAAHRSAHALRPNRTGADGEVVAIVALSDTILYQAVVAGCIVAGLVKSACRRLITTNITLKSLIDGLRAQIAETPSLRSFDLQIEEIPSVFTAYPQLGQEKAEHPFERYPDPVKRPSRDDICIYLHSSGSTGFPKAIPQTHRAWMEWSMFRE